MDSDRPAAAQASPTQHAAERRHVLGRIAALLFLSGALASLAANPVLHAGPVPWWAHALCALAAVSAVVCLLVPFRRLSTRALHVVLVAATLEVGLTVAANGAGGAPFTWYFVLISVFAGYAFRTRRAVAAHLGLACAAIAAPVLGLWAGPPDAAVTALVAIPVLLVSAATSGHLRRSLERRHAELTGLAAQNAALLERSRAEALTDALSGLANRRRLMLDLERATDPAGAPGCVLALFDLDGFKTYNDTFGHPAGDALLALLGARLEAAVRGHGRAYRLGGDEFCVLLEPGAGTALLTAAAAALTQAGEHVPVGSSMGHVRLPEEAADAETALQVADRRMYADKGARRVTAHEAALGALLRRTPGTRVDAELAAALAQAAAGGRLAPAARPTGT